MQHNTSAALPRLPGGANRAARALQYHGPMCGRFDQSQTARFYANVFGWADAVYDSESTPAYNVPPGTYRPVMHIQDGERRIDDVFWSYRAKWAEGRLPISINARLDKLTNRYWSRLLKNGRDGRTGALPIAIDIDAARSPA